MVYGNIDFSRSSRIKTVGNIGMKFGTLHYVHHRMESANLQVWGTRGGGPTLGWNVTLKFFLSYLFFLSTNLQLRDDLQKARFCAQNTCSDSVLCLPGLFNPKNQGFGFPGPKTVKSWPPYGIFLHKQKLWISRERLEIGTKFQKRVIGSQGSPIICKYLFWPHVITWSIFGHVSVKVENINFETVLLTNQWRKYHADYRFEIWNKFRVKWYMTCK